MGEFMTLCSIKATNAAIILATSEPSEEVAEQALDTNHIESMLRLAGDYGMMMVACVILIIMTIVMFKKVMSGSSATDAKLAEAVTESLNTLTTAISGTMNIAEVFDRHNTKSTAEFDTLKRDMRDINDALKQIEKQNENILKMLDEQQAMLSRIDRNQ